MDATCTIQDSIHVFNLVHKYVSRILGTYQISRLVIGGFLDNVKKSPNLFQHGYLQLENFSGKLKIPPTYHRKPVKQSNKKS